jgi:site-specific DNA-methyltransferase (adenine-specific)
MASAGHVNRGLRAALKGDVEREKAAIGVFISLDEPTAPMTSEAVTAGYYHSPGWGKDYPRIQILTIDQLLHGAEIKMPPAFGTFKEAQRAKTEAVRIGFDDL